MWYNPYVYGLYKGVFMRVLMSAGGTGGHIYPALALADALKKEQHEIMFIGSKDRMEATLIPDA